MDENCNDVNCSVHNRVDSEQITDVGIRIVTYIGKYAVTTTTAPELQDPMIRTAQMLGLATFPRLVTVVCLVGSDTETLNGSVLTVDDDEFMRFVQRHDNVADPKTPHDMVVSEVKAGTIDLSGGITGKSIAEEAKQYMPGIF